MKFKIKDKYKKFCELLDFGHGKYGVRIDIWTHFMRGCIIDYVH